MKKTNKYFIYSTIIGLFTALFFSCQSDIRNTVATITGTVDNDVLNAQAWYNSTRQDTILSLEFAKVKSTKKNMTAKPDWKHTYTLREKDYSAVHVQLSMKGTFCFVTPENKQAYNATGNERYIKTFTRMVVLTNKKNNSTVGFLMTLVPDKAYIESTHFDALRSNYKQWQKGYSGYVFYHNLDGKFNNGWRFANGKVIKEVTQNAGTDLNLNMGVRKKVTADTQCTDYYYEIYSQDCRDWTSNGEYVGTTCSGNWYFDRYEYAYTECTSYGDTGGGGGDGGNGNAGGNGGFVIRDCAGVRNGLAYFSDCMECIGGTTGKEICPICGGIATLYIDDETNPLHVKSANPVCARCTCIRTISSSKFNISGLNPEEIEFLESMYKKLQEDCLYKSIDNYMLGGDMTYGTITIAKPPYGRGEASTTYLGDLKLIQGLQTEYRTFRHEWRHFYQRELWNISTDAEVTLKKGMMEFENAVYGDIEIYRKGFDATLSLDDQNAALKLCDNEEQINSWIYTLDRLKPLGYVKNMKEYKDWIIRLSTGTVNLKDPNEIATTQKWAILFGQYDLKYGVGLGLGYQYEGVDYQFNALSDLIQQTNNCK